MMTQISLQCKTLHTSLINDDLLLCRWMNDLDYCVKCNKLCDYLDLKPHNMRWYCKKCYKEASEDYPVLITLNLFELNDYDYCSACGKLFDYLDLRPHELKWYCEQCFRAITSKDKVAEMCNLARR